MMTNRDAWMIARLSLGTILGLKTRAWLIDRGWCKGLLVEKSRVRVD